MALNNFHLILLQQKICANTPSDGHTPLPDGLNTLVCHSLFYYLGKPDLPAWCPSACAVYLWSRPSNARGFPSRGLCCQKDTLLFILYIYFIHYIYYIYRYFYIYNIYIFIYIIHLPSLRPGGLWASRKGSSFAATFIKCLCVLQSQGWTNVSLIW